MPIYLDNAATTFPKPEAVYRAVDDAMRTVGVAPGRGGYKRGLEAARLVFQAREAIATLFGIVDSARVVFTHNATEALNLAVSGLLKPGDHVVTTTMEHNSLARPLYLASQKGVEITMVGGDQNGFIAAERIAAAMRANTRLVALTHCSNVTGTIQPVEEIGAMVRKCGAFFLVDAAQSAGTIPIDVCSLGIDLLAAPGHKGLFGPQGTGFLYIAEGIDLEPLVVGGTGSSSSDLQQPGGLPDRFESGTMNTPGIAGLKAGVEFILAAGIDAIASKEAVLVNMLLEGLVTIPGITMYGPGATQPRGSVVSFTIAGHDPSHVGFLLDRDHDISVRIGLHCAVSAHKTLGTYPAGTVRVSPGYFNTPEDIAIFLHALRGIVHSP